MTIIDAYTKRDLNASKIQPFLDNIKDATSNIIVYDNASQKLLTTVKATFVNDVLISGSISRNSSLTDTDKLVAVVEDECLVFAVSDVRWYDGHAKRINKLLLELSGEKLLSPSEQTKQNAQLALLEEQEAMSKLRIVAFCIKNDSSTIEAYKGNGEDCVMWLNRKIVEFYQNVSTFKICLDLNEHTTMSDFKTIDELANEGKIKL